MSKTLNWGILGTAKIGKAVIPGIRDSKRSHLQGIASRSISSAKEYANIWNIPQIYGSYDELLADQNIDVVYIPLPNHLHAEWTIKAAQAGKHVLCEKPITLTLEEIDKVIKARDDHGVIIAEAFMYRHHPQTKKVQELISEKAIGEVKFIRGSFSFMLGIEEDIRWELGYGGGALWDVGCYPVSFTLMVLNDRPQEIKGFRTDTASGVPKSYSGMMRFGNDVVAQFDCAFDLPYNTSMEIRGTEGSIIVPQPFKPEQISQIVLSLENKEQTFSFNYKNLYLGEIEDMERSILDSQPPMLSLEESKVIAETLIELHKIGI